jgi:hypothetical protein
MDPFLNHLRLDVQLWTLGNFIMVFVEGQFTRFVLTNEKAKKIVIFKK